MSSKEKNQEQTVVMPPSPTEKDVFTVTDIRKALDQLSISAHQKKLILEQLIIPPPPAAAAAPAPSASTVPNSSAATTLATDKASAVDDDVDTTHGSDDLIDDEVEDAYGDDDDDDDDSGYDGNVQYPYHPQPQSKIQYDSDEDSFEDCEFSQQVNYN